VKLPLVTIGVAVLVVLAGCPSTVDDPPATETVTPVPVPTTEIQYPPGVSESGASGPGLAAAHDRVLEGTNYTLVIRQQIVRLGDNQTLQEIESTRQVRAGGEVYTGQYVRLVSRFPIRRPANTIDYWSDGEVFAARQSRTGRHTYVEAGEEAPIADIDDAEFVNRSVSALRFDVTKRGEGSVTLRVAGLRDSGAMPTPVFVYDVQNVSGAISVRPDGVVTAVRITYDARLGDERIRVTRRSRVGRLGSTVVERPDWVDEARNRSDSGTSRAEAGAPDTDRTA